MESQRHTHTQSRCTALSSPSAAPGPISAGVDTCGSNELWSGELNIEQSKEGKLMKSTRQKLTGYLLLLH